MNASWFKWLIKINQSEILKSAIVLTSEMKAHNRVIKRAGFVDKGVVTLKGRVTCEINSNH